MKKAQVKLGKKTQEIWLNYDWQKRVKELKLNTFMYESDKYLKAKQALFY